MRVVRLFPLALLLVAVPAFATTQLFFSDVPPEHPNKPAIAYAFTHGFVQGYPDRTFRPDQPINRAEFTKIIASAYGDAEISSCHLKRDLGKMFPDMRSTDWYAPYVCVANQHKMVHGYPDGYFRGSALINFAEASKILTFREPLNNPFSA